MKKIKRCPCGLTPTSLDLQDIEERPYMIIIPNCCEDWSLDFRPTSEEWESGDILELVINRWNSAIGK